MLDTFDQTTNWTALTDAANLARNTTTVLQGSASFSMDKTGGTVTTALAQRKLQVPIDISSLRATLTQPLLKLRTYHANYNNVSKVIARLVYRFDTTGAADVYDQFEIVKASLSNSTWNTLSVALDSPSSTSATVPTTEHRSHCIAYQVGVIMNAAANTITALLLDAFEITATTPPVALIFDSAERLVLPPFDVWNCTPAEMLQIHQTPTAVQSSMLERFYSIAMGYQQARHVYRPQSIIHTIEAALREFSRYIASNPGWALARPAGELVDTTLTSATAAGDLTLSVASTTELAFLGLTGTLEAGYADLRLGPNATRDYDFVRAIGYSGTTVYLHRPVRQVHASGAVVRSAGYWPSLARTSAEFPVQETGNAVRFHMTAREIG